MFCRAPGSGIPPLLLWKWVSRSPVPLGLNTGSCRAATRTYTCPPPLPLCPCGCCSPTGTPTRTTLSPQSYLGAMVYAGAPAEPEGTPGDTCPCVGHGRSTHHGGAAGAGGSSPASSPAPSPRELPYRPVAAHSPPLMARSLASIWGHPKLASTVPLSRLQGSIPHAPHPEAWLGSCSPKSPLLLARPAHRKPL